MKHLDYDTLLALHAHLMRELMGERFFGVLNENLLRSALARPVNAEAYEHADGLRPAAHLFHGLLTNHGFVQGNKRTAYLALEWFLWTNQLGEIRASDDQIVSMCLAAIRERWDIAAVETWLRGHVAPAH